MYSVPSDGQSMALALRKISPRSGCAGCNIVKTAGMSVTVKEPAAGCLHDGQETDNSSTTTATTRLNFRVLKASSISEV
jgi:hypothetical protein